jgi:hypothetical protein
MSFQQTLDVCCSINHYGATLLRHGDFDGAILSFTQALSSIRSLCQLGCCTVKGDFETEITLIQGHSKTSLDTSLFHSDQDDSNPSSFFGFVYPMPIEIPTEMEMPIQAYSIAVMFNLAIAFHLKGLRHHLQSEQDYIATLDSARRLYELCYEMMMHERINPGLEFVMAIANNLGHLQNVLQAYDKARVCFEHLLSIQMLVLESNGGGCTSEDEFTRATWAGFCHNTSQLILSNCCASAA